MELADFDYDLPADAKLDIMEACGFTVTRNPSEMAKLLKALL
jgi:succinyl-CoA synthetase alpha subunit